MVFDGVGCMGAFMGFQCNRVNATRGGNDHASELRGHRAPMASKHQELHFDYILQSKRTWLMRAQEVIIATATLQPAQNVWPAETCTKCNARNNVRVYTIMKIMSSGK